MRRRLRLALTAPMVAGAAVVLAGTARADAVADGQAAYDRHDLAGALAIWSEAARAGNARAAFDLGLLYDLTSPLPDHAAKAFGWYQQAAQAGLADAEFNVAVMLDSGQGVARDGAAAALWYGRAAAHGNARAAYDLAQLYAAGDGVALNSAMAAAWARRAVARGIPAAARFEDAEERAGTGTLQAVLPEPAAVVGGGHGAAELVWLAPQQPVAAHYVVEIDAIDDGRLRPVAQQSTAVSAALIDLPAGHSGRYVWRVYSVADRAPRYAAGPWGLLAPAAGLIEAARD
jgi:hypothetical protein